MGIALFSANTLIESLQGVMGWLVPRVSRMPGMPRAASLRNTPPEVWHRPARARSRNAHAAHNLADVAHGNPASVKATDHAAAPLLPCATATRQGARNARTQRPLRVVRVLDGSATSSPASASASFAGRMVISGRMADVCAELDRLAALESATPAAMALG